MARIPKKPRVDGVRESTYDITKSQRPVMVNACRITDDDLFRDLTPSKSVAKRVEIMRDDEPFSLDAMILKVRDRIGCGYGITVVAPTPNHDHVFRESRVCVSWHRLSAMRDKDGGRRVVFARDLTTALDYVMEYERRYDAEGADAAAAWHKAETKRREVDEERAIAAAVAVREGR